MEVAGLVLGALPLAIHALQAYRTILSSIRNTKYELGSMIRGLNTEIVILQNTCEILLRGIASDSEIEEMIENPYGDAWKKYNDEVRMRLWRSGPVFQDQVNDMMNATKELQEKLAIDDQGKTRLTDRMSIMAELKLKTSFTLRKAAYNDILSRLQDGNAVLRSLVQQNDGLELTRRSRAQGKAASLIRRLSAGIFSALQEAMTCTCTWSHDIGLVITQRKPIILPGIEEEEAARDLHFDLVCSYGGYGGNLQRWKGMQVKLSAKEAGLQAPPPSQAQPSPPGGRLIRWASTLSARSKEAQPASAPAPLSHPTTSFGNTVLAQSHITNLCDILSKDGRISPDYYGYIRDGTSNKFDLHCQHRPLPYTGAVTLREILDGARARIDVFGYPERLELALTLSFGVLHLYSTPWLSKTFTLDDIVFLHGKKGSGPDTCYLHRPFLAKQVSQASRQAHAAFLTPSPPKFTSQHQTIPANTYRPIDPTLLSLGLLLIQIITGNYFVQLLLDDGMTLDDLLKKRTVASRMAGMVLQNGGMNYAGAVQWCLENFLSPANLDNAELARQFYDAVICRLETDMKLQNTATVS